jgi:hypothetical protein
MHGVHAQELDGFRLLVPYSPVLLVAAPPLAAAAVSRLAKRPRSGLALTPVRDYGPACAGRASPGQARRRRPHMPRSALEMSQVGWRTRVAHHPTEGNPLDALSRHPLPSYAVLDPAAPLRGAGPASAAGSGLGRPRPPHAGPHASTSGRSMPAQSGTIAVCYLSSCWPLGAAAISAPLRGACCSAGSTCRRWSLSS